MPQSRCTLSKHAQPSQTHPCYAIPSSGCAVSELSAPFQVTRGVQRTQRPCLWVTWGQERLGYGGLIKECNERDGELSMRRSLLISDHDQAMMAASLLPGSGSCRAHFMYCRCGALAAAALHSGSSQPALNRMPTSNGIGKKIK